MTQIFRLSFFLMTLTALRTNGQVFCQMPLSIGICFCHDCCEVMSFGEEDHRNKNAIFITSYQGYKLATWFMTVNVDLYRLAEGVFVIFLHCKVALFFNLAFCNILPGRKSLLCRPHVMSVEVGFGLQGVGDQHLTLRTLLHETPTLLPIY